MKRAVRLALRPSGTSRRVLGACEWVRRSAFNAALAWHLAERVAGRSVPGEYATARWLREWRKAASVEKPDLLKVPARIFEYAAEDLERGWRAVHNLKNGRPCFVRFDSQAGGFAVDGSIIVTETHIRLPKIGKVRLMPNVRPSARSGRLPVGAYHVARLVREHGEWFVSVIREVANPVRAEDITPTIGLDPGVRKLATLSDGTIFENPKALEQVAKKAEKYRLSIARKRRAADMRFEVRKKGERRASSNRLKRAQRQLGRQLQRAAHIRKNAIEHATSAIARDHVVVAVEDTDVRSMTRKRIGRGRAAKASLNRRILDAAPGMLLTTLDRKLRDRRGGGTIKVAAPFTSQDCSHCGCRNDCGSSETYICAACGLIVDRDVNAANNILARARVAVAGWSTAEKSAWEQGKTARVNRSARAKIRAQIRKEAA